MYLRDTQLSFQSSFPQSPFLSFLQFLQFSRLIDPFLALSEPGNVPGLDSMRNNREEFEEVMNWLEEWIHCGSWGGLEEVLDVDEGEGENFRLDNAERSTSQCKC